MQSAKQPVGQPHWLTSGAGEGGLNSNCGSGAAGFGDNSSRAYNALNRNRNEANTLGTMDSVGSVTTGSKQSHPPQWIKP